MSGWSYGDFCNGCPQELFCDWYCPPRSEGCESCAAYKLKLCEEGKCNNQVSYYIRKKRNFLTYLRNILFIIIDWLESKFDYKKDDWR